MKRFAFVAILLAVVLSGCGGGGGGSSSGPTKKFVATENLTPAGGTITVPVAGVSVTVPAGVLSESGSVTATVCRGSAITTKPAATGLTYHTSVTLSTDAPTNNGQASVNVGSLNLPTDAVAIGAYLQPDETWKYVAVPTSGAVSVPVSSNQTGRGVGQAIISLVVGYVVHHNTETSGWEKLAGTGSSNAIPSTGNVLVCVHGMASKNASMSATATAAIKSAGFNSVYAFGYDWTRDIAANAADFRAALKAMPVNQTVTIVAHSMGGLVARYALEQDPTGDRASFRVNRLILLESPMAGSKFAAKAMPDVLFDWGLNDNASWCDWVSLSGLAQATAPSLLQMVAGSDFLKVLDAPSNHLNTTPYYTVDGSMDSFVSSSSAHHLPTYATLGLEATGTEWACGHMGVWERMTDAIIGLLNDTKLGEGPTVSVSLENGGRPYDDGWYYTLTVLGGGSTAVPFAVSEIIIKASSRDGTENSRQWYADVYGGEFFPDERIGYNLTLDQFGAWQRSLRCTFDYERHNYSDAKYNNRAKMHDIYVNGINGFGQPFSVHCQFALLDKDGSGPSTPRAVVVPRLVPGGTMLRAK